MAVAFLVAKALSQSILDCLEVDSVKSVSNEQMTIFNSFRKRPAGRFSSSMGLDSYGLLGVS